MKYLELDLDVEERKDLFLKGLETLSKDYGILVCGCLKGNDNYYYVVEVL